MVDTIILILYETKIVLQKNVDPEISFDDKSHLCGVFVFRVYHLLSSAFCKLIHWIPIVYSYLTPLIQESLEDEFKFDHYSKPPRWEMNIFWKQVENSE